MTGPGAHEVTQLLLAWSEGDEAALEKLVPFVYEELHRLARRYMSRESPDHVLQTTALVHEAYLRLVDQKRVRWQNRFHFFGVAAQMMRRILVDFARSQHRRKRGGGGHPVSLAEALEVPYRADADLVAFDDVLCALAAFDPRKARVVELRFFGGLTVEETAEALKVSPETVMRDWSAARAWLYRELRDQASSREEPH